MKCPKCGSDTRIVPGRQADYDHCAKRWRECTGCKVRRSTTEKFDNLPYFQGRKSAVQIIGEAVAAAYEKATGQTLQGRRPSVMQVPSNKGGN